MQTHAVFISVALCVAAMAGCGGAPVAEDRPEVVIFAAASTTNAVEEAAAAIEARLHVDITLSFAASSTLAHQIAAGAPADIYISANERWADFLDEKGLVERRAEALGNRVVLITQRDGGLGRLPPELLANAEVDAVAMADPESVPAGMYGKRALQTLGLWERVVAKVIVAMDVRQALLLVERGEAPAGVVYATDAAISDGVQVAHVFPPELTGEVRYSFVLLTSSAGSGPASEVYEALVSNESLAVFKRYGFTLTGPAA
jgi:molybdate transport system substrate-binding protein